MNYLVDEFFPIKRSFPERAANWVRCNDKCRIHKYDNILRVTEYIVRAPMPEVVGKKIAFVSDWHWYGSATNFKVLEALEKALSKNEVDYLILGGDICEDADRIDKLPSLLKRLRILAKQCLAIPGNWESGKRWLPENFWKDLYAEQGITFLKNDYFQDEFFRFHGIDDISSGDCRFGKNMKPIGSLPVAEIMLAHNPDTVIALDENGALRDMDVILCGHNHGGQIRLPFIGALYCPSRYGRYFDRGEFSRQATHLRMIISNGMGEASETFRWNCSREAVIVSFRPSKHYRLRNKKTVR